MKIKETEHNGFTINVTFNESDNTFSASSICGNSHNKFDNDLNNFTHGYSKPQEAIDDVIIKIENFLIDCPKTYKELANSLTRNLTWTGYEDCHLEESIVKVLVNNFIKYKNK